MLQHVFFASLFFIFSAQAHGQFFGIAKEDLNNGSVVVEKETNYSSNYKDRRGKHGVLVSMFSESFYPFDYQSLEDRSILVENFLDGSKLSILGFEIGYKYNFSAGSIAALVNFGNGFASSATRDLAVAKKGIAVNYAADNFLKEPWVVPYGQLGIHQFSVIETSDITESSADAGPALNYKIGVLFQLDWIEKAIDKSTQVDGLKSSGLENTFIDVYIAEHLAASGAIDPNDTTGEGDPNLYSSSEIGMGIKLEF